MKDTSILADSEFRDKLDQWIAASIEYCVNHYKPIRVYEAMWVDWSGLMVMAAHRYCLGRRSYIVGCCIEWLETIWDKIEDGDKYIILRDTYEALMDGYAGGKSDAQAWKGFADDMLLTLEPVTRGCLILELSNRTNRTGIMPAWVVENKQP